MVYGSDGSCWANIKIQVKNGYCNLKWSMDKNESEKQISTKPMKMQTKEKN